LALPTLGQKLSLTRLLGLRDPLQAHNSPLLASSPTNRLVEESSMMLTLRKSRERRQRPLQLRKHDKNNLRKNEKKPKKPRI